MLLIQNILYGIISGITEFLPVSSRAHQFLLRYLFGAQTRDPLQDLLVHIGVFFAIIFACRENLAHLRREQKSLSASRRKRIRPADVRTLYDLRLLKTAAFPLIIGLFLSFYTKKMENSLLAIMGFLILNSFILLLADHVSHGNRDSRTMTGLDGIIMGLVGALSAFPGISRTGMISAYTTMRGADGQNTANWSILLGLPAMIFAIIYDIVGLAAGGIVVSGFAAFFGCLLSGIAAFGSGYFGISLLRIVMNNSGFSKFAYYSLGAAFFSFILYLIT